MVTDYLKLDVKGHELHVGERVIWLDDAGWDDELDRPIHFTVVDEDVEQDGYFNIAYDGEENPDRWAWHLELKVI